MAPSLFSTLSSVLLLTSSVSAHKSYQVVDSYDSTNFLDKFGFFVSDHSSANYNDVDPTGGYVSYKSAEEARSMGILKTVGEDLYLGVDSKSVLDPNGIGRASVRIESKSKYKQGLFVATFSHLPKPVCGAWPAFWTVGNPWPDAGEVDIVETWNEDNVNKVVLHTDERIGECRIDGEGMTGTVSKPNCANFAVGQADNEGCAGLDPAAPFGSAEGGVYAMQWTDDAIKVWGFTHADAPADIAANHPDPAGWGVPSFTTSACAADKLFGEAKLVMNVNLCGVAGQDGIWDTCKAKTGGATCKQWVAENPAAFAEVYFQLRSVKIYSLKEDEAEATTSSAVSSQLASTAAGTTAVASTAVASTSAAASGTAVVSSENPVETVSPSASAPASAPASASTSVIASETPVDTPVDTPVETPPAESLTTRLATSTVYETNIKTITSCAPEVTDCPARTSTLTTREVIPTTTAIPVESYVPPEPTADEPTADEPVVTVSSQKPVGDVTTALTTYRTNIVTITSCAPDVPDCPARTSTVVTSEVVPTTIPAVPGTTEAEKPVVTEQPPAQITTYKTNIVTITSCAPDVLSCPARTSTVIASEVVPAPTTEGEKPIPVTTTEVEEPVVTEQPPVQITTYKTNIVTITSCAPDVPDCPARTSTVITSELISTTVPVLGVPGKPTDVSQNPPVPVGGEEPITNPVVPGGGEPIITPVVPGEGEEPATTPVVPGKPTTPLPEYSTISTPGAGVPTVGVPVSGGGEATSAQEPVPAAAMPTTLVVAPSSPYNGTLSTARIPGVSEPCVGAACPATTTGPVQAGAGKVGPGAFLLAAALAALAI